MLECTNRASAPSPSASLRATLIASTPKSTPVTLAPSRAQHSVSTSKWYWTCKSDLPATSPTWFWIYAGILFWPALNPATSLVRARYLVPPALICRKRLAGGDITRQFPAVGHASTRISV